WAVRGLRRVLALCAALRELRAEAGRLPGGRARPGHGDRPRAGELLLRHCVIRRGPPRGPVPRLS
ncbi:hypothetical protein ACQRUO_39510, partial [Kitasatospora sp. LaBMicrA B282]